MDESLPRGIHFTHHSRNHLDVSEAIRFLDNALTGEHDPEKEDESSAKCTAVGAKKEEHFLTIRAAFQEKNINIEEKVQEKWTELETSIPKAKSKRFQKFLLESYGVQESERRQDPAKRVVLHPVEELKTADFGEAAKVKLMVSARICSLSTRA